MPSIFDKESRLRKDPAGTLVAVLAMLFIFGLIVLGGLLGVVGVKGAIGGLR